jgi:hypothetical protein
MEGLRSRRVSSASKSLDVPGSHLRPPSLRSWLCGSTKHPDNFVVNHRKPRVIGAAFTPIPLMTLPPRCPGMLFFLLFLPPCGPHLISFGHQVRRAEPTCLSTPRRPHRLRPFAPALHLHQRKSRRNLHLQYSTKSQFTPRCQSLITPRSDHPSVVGRSGPR